MKEKYLFFVLIDKKGRLIIKAVKNQNYEKNFILFSISNYSVWFFRR